MSHIGRSFMILAVLLLAIVVIVSTPQGREMAANLSASLSILTVNVTGGK